MFFAIRTRIFGNKKAGLIAGFFIDHTNHSEIGRGGGIRTHDHYPPRVVRYQAALRPDEKFWRKLMRRESYLTLNALKTTTLTFQQYQQFFQL
jgi:hypothetical protein